MGVGLRSSQPFIGLLLSLGVAQAFPSTVDPEAVLSRVRDKVEGHLSQLPNYTCHEVINRFIQPVNGSALRQYDQVEFEVAFVEYRELFAASRRDALPRTAHHELSQERHYWEWRIRLHYCQRFPWRCGRIRVRWRFRPRWTQDLPV